MTSNFFQGRLVLVTGGGSGIGRCVCHALAKEGSRVIVADIDLNAAETTLGSLPEHLQAVFQNASIVINSAGMGMKTTDLVDLAEKYFDDIVRVNIKGTFLVNQAAARAMTAGSVRDGAIVNIASLEATQCSPGWSAYAAAKAGVVALTKVAAKELASLGIRVNCVLPTVTDTPMSAPGKHTEERKKLLASIPLKRPCRPEEVTEVILFLCGPGSSFMSGAAVDISGGL
ncbi:hypothetical protein HPB47_003309 [Ixodes persulcatus]|uniref:Uncharacterized protein n=1 Tax=Ixodes persulcatus TaxID=34615 RepID=A0AC60PIV9_IXOPE|nr:hypothetical protein HPB47_003309 [Ixodes persulcatus]